MMPTRRKWIAAWPGGAGLFSLNGAVREYVYRRRVGDLAAGQISTVSGLALLTWYLWLLHRRWPLPDRSTALQVGLGWVLLTELFEFGVGHFVQHKPWAELLEDYDLPAGRLWVLVPLWMMVAPEAIRALRTRP